MSVLHSTQKTIRVNMADLEFGRADDVLETLLGSCVGIVVWDRSRRHGGMAHIMLAASQGRQASAGKYADTAVPALIRQLQAWGSSTADLVAKLAGGANMFGSHSANDVGENNLRAVEEHLGRFGVRIAARHVGGTQGRLIRFRPADGSLEIIIARQTAAVI